MNKPKKRSLVESTEEFLNTIWELLDTVGKKIFGELWESIYLTVQDGIGLYIIVHIPSLIMLAFFGKTFFSYSVCLSVEDYLSPIRAGCFVIVTADFCVWMVLAGRIIGRFLEDSEPQIALILSSLDKLKKIIFKGDK